MWKPDTWQEVRLQFTGERVDCATNSDLWSDWLFILGKKLRWNPYLTPCIKKSIKDLHAKNMERFLVIRKDFLKSFVSLGISY